MDPKGTSEVKTVSRLYKFPKIFFGDYLFLEFSNDDLNQSVMLLSASHMVDVFVNIEFVINTNFLIFVP